MHPPLHPQIERLAKESAIEMGAATVAAILGLSYDTVKRLSSGDAPQISCQVVRDARKRSEAEWAKRGQITTRRNKRAKERRTFTKLDVLAYIIRSTAGDRSLVMRAVERHMPAWLAIAKDIAAEAQQPQATPQPLPANVIPIKRGHAKRPPADPFAGHPEFPFSNSASA